MTPEAMLLLALHDYELEEVLEQLDITKIEALVVLFQAGYIDEERLKEMVGL